MTENGKMPPEEYTAAALELQRIVTRAQQNNEELLELQEEAVGAALAEILGPLIQKGEDIIIISRWLLKLGVKELRFRLDKMLEIIQPLK